MSADDVNPSLPKKSDFRVLVAEDNPTSRMYVEELLKRTGVDCELVENGMEAVRAVRHGKFDLVLMDCHMPQMDGFKATAAIRDFESETAGGQRLPIVALTANAIKGDRERCIEAGMDDYLSKPFEASQLIEKLEQWLSRSEPATCADEAIEADSSSSEESQPDAPFSVETVLSRCMDDHEFLESALRNFAEETPRYLDELEQLIHNGDAVGVQRGAHSIKGAAGLITAEAVRLAASGIEQSARELDLEAARSQVDQLRNELERCIEHIAAVRRDHGVSEQEVQRGE